MKIPLKAKVICKDGEYGRVKELLIDPVKEKVTHIVAENSHRDLEVIVPIEDVDYTTDSVVTIEKEATDIDKYPLFIINEFVTIPNADLNTSFWGADSTMGHSYTMFPYVVHEGKASVEVKREDIPKGEFSLRKGMVVKDSKGDKLGAVDELVVDEKSDVITHVVMRTGHLWGAREVVVPSVDVSSYNKDEIILTIGREDIENLPDLLLKRAWK